MAVLRVHGGAELQEERERVGAAAVRRAHQRRPPTAVPRRRRMHKGPRRSGLGRHQGRKQKGRFSRVGVAPKERGVKGYGVSPKALIFGQNGQRIAGSARSTFGSS